MAFKPTILLYSSFDFNVVCTARSLLIVSSYDKGLLGIEKTQKSKTKIKHNSIVQKKVAQPF
jgi:hypothetical protein